MAGFYIHIPLCRKVCYYCDFHFVASLKYKDLLIEAIIKEIETRSYDWKDIAFDTLYFGGGTPTVLSINEITRILQSIYKNYTIKNNPEITIEANPDDLSTDYLKAIKENSPINRLSIGIQSFRNEDLLFMNRRHTSSQAVDCIKEAKNNGFENITIDLIYGIPGLSNKEWGKNIDTYLSLDISHLSAYHLSIEPKTVFGVMQKRSKLKAIDEELSLEQYQMLIDRMKVAGYEHYEISNFARDGMFSKHNSSYWNGTSYIGIGPSAHSFDGSRRRWNIANNSIYCNSLLKNAEPYFETEDLSLKDKFNDYIITTLRTKWGANLEFIGNNFGKGFTEHCLKVLDKIGKTNNIHFDKKNICLTEKGWFIADFILSEFIFT